MKYQQSWALFAPYLVVLSMHPVFLLTAIRFPDRWRMSWTAGLILYWLTWGIGYPLLSIGRTNIKPDYFVTHNVSIQEVIIKGSEQSSK